MPDRDRRCLGDADANNKKKQGKKTKKQKNSRKETKEKGERGYSLPFRSCFFILSSDGDRFALFATPLFCSNYRCLQLSFNQVFNKTKIPNKIKNHSQTVSLFQVSNFAACHLAFFWKKSFLYCSNIISFYLDIASISKQKY